MKKVLLLALALVSIATGANAQNFGKGDWMLRADVSNLQLGYAFRDGISVTSFNVGANAGYFLADRFAVDVSMGLDYGKLKGADATSDFSFGAGVRYYPVGNLFARVGYIGSASDGSSLRSLLGVSVGYDLFVSEKVFFEPSVVYSRNLVEGGLNNLGLSIGIGVRF